MQVEVLNFCLTCGHEWSLHAKVGVSACGSDGCGCPGFAFSPMQVGRVRERPAQLPAERLQWEGAIVQEIIALQEQLRDANNLIDDLAERHAATCGNCLIDRSFERKSRCPEMVKITAYRNRA